MEKIVLTKEESQHLIDLGVPKEKATGNCHIVIQSNYPIFTLTDLLDILPPEFWNCDLDDNMLLCMSYNDGLWHAEYTEESFRHKFVHGCSSEELIDALYKLLIWAIENKHLIFIN